MLKFGKLTEAYQTIGADQVVYKDYPKGYEAAINKMLSRVSHLPGFKILSIQDIDMGKFWWRLAELTYTYDSE